MAHEDMTIAEVLKDPLIRQMMRADGVSLREMEELLHTVRVRRMPRRIHVPQETAGIRTTPSPRPFVKPKPLPSAATGAE